jgi:hypothetical protein
MGSRTWAPNRSSPLLPDATSEEQPTGRLQNHGDFEGSGIWVVMIIDPWPDPQYVGKYDHHTACHSRYQQDQHFRRSQQTLESAEHAHAVCYRR